MDRRTRILASLFGLTIAYVVIAQVVYPTWIVPLLTIDQRVAERQTELEKLQTAKKEVEAAKVAYRDFLARAGSFDVIRVETDVRGRLNQLIEKHGLRPANVSGGRTSRDSKTGVETAFLDVTAEAPLSAVVQFMKEVSELPHLIRLANVKISPTAGGRKDRDREAERVSLNMPIEIRVLPEQRKLLGKVDEAKLVRPQRLVRHLDRDYSGIWDRKPFTEYEKLIPLVVTARQPVVTVDVGQSATMQVTVTGGNGQHSYSWSPPTGLANAAVLNPTVDTSAARVQTYTLTVTDQRGQTGTATVNVTVKERVVVQQPEQPKAPPPPPPPPPPRGRQRWPNGRELQLAMFLSREEGSAWHDELMVYDQKARSSAYYKVGDAFDGGKLVYLSARGAVVNWEDEYWVYPLGSLADISLTAADVREMYPELAAAADRHKVANAERGAASTGGVGGGPTAQVKAPSSAEIAGQRPMTPLPGELVGPPEPAEEAVSTQPVAMPGPPADAITTLPGDGAVAKPAEDPAGTKSSEQPGAAKQRPRRPARTGGPKSGQPRGNANPPAGAADGGQTQPPNPPGSP